MKKWLFYEFDADSTIIAAIVVNTIGLIVFYFMTLILVDTTKALDSKNMVYSICDGYAQIMMSEGYLTTTDQAEMEAALANIGVTNIDWTGTTLTQANYGDRIYLKIEFDMAAKSHSVASTFSLQVTDQTVRSSYYRATTCFK